MSTSNQNKQAEPVTRVSLTLAELTALVSTFDCSREQLQGRFGLDLFRKLRKAQLTLSEGLIVPSYIKQNPDTKYSASGLGFTAEEVALAGITTKNVDDMTEEERNKLDDELMKKLGL